MYYLVYSITCRNFASQTQKEIVKWQLSKKKNGCASAEGLQKCAKNRA